MGELTVEHRAGRPPIVDQVLQMNKQKWLDNQTAKTSEGGRSGLEVAVVFYGDCERGGESIVEMGSVGTCVFLLYLHGQLPQNGRVRLRLTHSPGFLTVKMGEQAIQLSSTHQHGMGDTWVSFKIPLGGQRHHEVHISAQMGCLFKLHDDMVGIEDPGSRDVEGTRG